MKKEGKRKDGEMKVEVHFIVDSLKDFTNTVSP